MSLLRWSRSKNLWIGSVINRLDKERAEFAKQRATENSQLETHRRPPAVRSHTNALPVNRRSTINCCSLQVFGLWTIHKLKRVPNSTSGDVLAAAGCSRATRMTTRIHNSDRSYMDHTHSIPSACYEAPAGLGASTLPHKATISIHYRHP